MRDPVHVLLVEDDDDLATCLAAVLQEEGYTTVVSHDGQAAIDECARVPALVLVDFFLPGQPTGADLVQALRAALPRSSRVLIMSAVREVEQHALAAGADGYLEKPFDIDLFLGTVEEQMRATRAPEIAPSLP